MSPGEQITQLEAAIAHLEAQRSALGDAVVETGIAPLRQQLSELRRAATAGPAPSLEGERKLVTVMFADISGFTTLAETVDPEVVRDLTNACFDQLAPVIEKYEGTVDKFIGDKIMALFGAPVTHENDPERALRAALEMMDALADFNAKIKISEIRGEKPRRDIALKLHFGINTGLVIAGGIGTRGRQKYSVMGDAVNLASRLEEISEPGQILVGPHTHRLTASLFEFKPLESERGRPFVAIKGRHQPVAVYQVLRARERPEAIRGLPGLRSPLVGRDVEYITLGQCLDQLLAGQGQIVSIIGEAGIGKSRLMAELRNQVFDDKKTWFLSTVTWLEGRSLSYGWSLSYLPFLEIVRGILGVTADEETATVQARLREKVEVLFPDRVEEVYPYLGQLLDLSLEEEMKERLRHLDGETIKWQIFRAVGDLLARLAVERPLILAFEDLHWADPTSVELLEHILPLTEDVPLMIVCVYRPQVEAACWRIREKAAQDFSHRYTEVWLQALSPAESERLMGQLLTIEGLTQQVCDLVLSKAGGNPLFVEEIIRSLIDSAALVQEEGRWRVAAAVGEIAIPDTLQGVLMARIDHLEEDTRRTMQLASVIGRIFLYRILAAISDVEKALNRHMATLQWLELIRERSRTPELEYIFKHALIQEAAYHSLLLQRRREIHFRIGECIERLFADRLEEYYGLLAHHYSKAEEQERALKYLLKAGDHAVRIHATAEAVAYYERAMSLLDREREPTHTAGVLMHLAGVVHYTGRYDQAREYFQQALALYEKVGDPIHAAEACFEIANRLEVHDLDAAFQYTLRGLEYVRDRPDACHQIIVGYSDLAQLQLSRGNYEEAEEALRYALALAEETNDLDALWQCYRVLSIYHHSRGEGQEALEAGTLVVHYIEQAEAPVKDRIIALNNQACFAQRVGDLEAAIEAGEAGLALARRAGVFSEQVILASTLADIYNYTGDWDMAERVLEEGLQLLAQRPHPYHEVALHLVAGDTAYGRGDWERAIAHWAEAEEKSHTGTPQIFTAKLRACLAMAWVQQGGLEQAERWASAARALAEEREQRGALAAGWRAQGMIERARGAWEAGEAAFGQALALARELDDPVEAARTLLEYSLLLLAAGRVEEGQARLRAAEERVAAISLHPVAQAARDALRVEVL